MKLGEVIERLERWKIDWLTPPMNGLGEVKHREFTDILRDLRALEGETRLPRIIEQRLIEPGARLTIERRTFRYHAELGETRQSAATQRAAIDALARELKKGKR